MITKIYGLLFTTVIGRYVNPPPPPRNIENLKRSRVWSLDIIIDIIATLLLILSGLKRLLC